jgi:glutamine cyclotransferase
VFLEGAVIFKNYIYMLTWQERKVFKLDPSDFSVVKELSWPKEGWGLATNGTHMFATDGSNNVYIVDENFNLL